MQVLGLIEQMGKLSEPVARCAGERKADDLFEDALVRLRLDADLELGGRAGGRKLEHGAQDLTGQRKENQEEKEALAAPGCQPRGQPVPRMAEEGPVAQWRGAN